MNSDKETLFRTQTNISNKYCFATGICLSERYSGIKNDSNLNKEMFEDMEQYEIPE